MIIVDVDGLGDAVVTGTSGMFDAASEVSQAFCSTPWFWIPCVVVTVILIVVWIFKRK